MGSELSIIAMTKVNTPQTNQGVFRYAFELIQQLQTVSDVTVISGKSQSFLGKLYFDLVTLPLSLKGKKADIYHAMSIEESIWPVLLNKRPLVTNIFDVIPLSYKKDSKLVARLYFWLASKFARRSDLIITCSDFSKKEIMQYLNVPSEKIAVIPVGFNLKLYKSLYSPSKKELGYIGGFRSRKNVDLIIRALEFMPNTTTLKIAGKGNTDSLKFLAQQLGVEDRVKFLGFIPDEELCEFYSSIDVFIFPSAYEGFGIPPIEAMACGCPVIVSNCSCLPEIVGSAAIIEQPDACCIAMAANSILSDEDIRCELIALGREQCKKYDNKITLSRHIEEYDKLLGE